jgi:hypothetical protein
MFSFERSNYLSRNTSDKLDDFFNEQDIVTSVVRESLQNILDAPAEDDQPVRARFSFRELNWEHFEHYAATSDNFTLNDHLNSSTLGRHAQSFDGQTIRTLLIEDYNTTGLIGSFDKNVPNSDSNLVNFWWNSGKGNKGTGGSNGSAGVGKICFIAASQMRTMWAVSKRLNDDETPKVLIGTTDLPYHHVGDVSYKGGAQFGTEFTNPETDQISFEPITNEDKIEEFENSFGVVRNDPGLSVIVPAVVDEITSETIKAAVLKQYFWAIINRKLIVEITADDGEISTLDPSTITEHLISRSSGEKLLERKVELALQAQSLLSDSSPVVFNGLEPKVQSGGEYGFPKEQITEANLSIMLDAYDRGDMIRVELSIPFTDLQSGEQDKGLLNLFFKQSESNVEMPKEFIRRSVSLTNMERALGRSIPKNVYCFLLIEDKAMSDFVVTAEDPAHIKLTKQKFRKERRFGPDAALTFVMEVEKLIYSILSRADEETELVENFDDEVFSVSLPDESQTILPKAKQKKKKKTNVPEIVIKERSEPLIVQSELTDLAGFELRSLPSIGDFIFDGEITLPLTLEIKAAYQTLSGPSDAWKHYSPIDFKMGDDIKIHVEPADKVQIIKQDGNNLKLEISSPEFAVKLTGFDRNRDLVTKAKIGT